MRRTLLIVLVLIISRTAFSQIVNNGKVYTDKNLRPTIAFKKLDSIVSVESGANALPIQGTVQGTVSISTFPSAIAGTSSLTTSTIAQSLDIQTCKRVTVVCTKLGTNDTIFVGVAGVTTLTGVPLLLLDSITLQATNVSEINVIGKTTSGQVRYFWEN